MCVITKFKLSVRCNTALSEVLRGEIQRLYIDR